MEKNYAKDRIENDIGFSLPDDDIVCKTCIFRKPDFVEGERVVVPGYKNGYCAIYDDDLKPTGILFRHEDCDYFEKEE